MVTVSGRSILRQRGTESSREEETDRVKQHESGKLTARERIKSLLLDAGTFRRRMSLSATGIRGLAWTSRNSRAMGWSRVTDM